MFSNIHLMKGTFAILDGPEGIHIGLTLFRRGMFQVMPGINPQEATAVRFELSVKPNPQDNPTQQYVFAVIDTVKRNGSSGTLFKLEGTLLFRKKSSTEMSDDSDTERAEVLPDRPFTADYDTIKHTGTMTLAQA